MWYCCFFYGDREVGVLNQYWVQWCVNDFIDFCICILDFLVIFLFGVVWGFQLYVFVYVDDGYYFMYGGVLIGICVVEYLYGMEIDFVCVRQLQVYLIFIVNL